ncbi:MAG: hypothetical protein CMQ38_01335 [Gammaproteobacteria bacterium]|nr:hypothetical protein [Gammaproteobacteria bacterium]|tara:strand:+ start:124 stop:534 length:411 start_codon:yes stop_codon:yes gene_type:complete
MSEYQLIQLPEHRDQRGSLSFAQIDDHVPFAIKRIFYLYDITSNEKRGDHAHRKQHQFLIMFNGSCRIEADSGQKKETIVLNKPSQAFYAPPLNWLVLYDFSPNAVCGVLVSGKFDEADYIYNYNEFKLLTREKYI